ncbi:FeoB-associated Cys-rich membrane protein [Solirubrum puertoriconensis]|uniref:FeoB-associated Cys-rich membrane protein n=1 Tax=Solirubrum puertoriconensis TaxID=1751427 RepID=A0A9X0L2Z2_SOLP1|nr:FeoB-associated Cys-rich membrane protein [Solirubrum puertoriconensis]KUG05946.1 hypothetical protein ASU33_00760 [Solirubrum puertoriconensis]
MLIQELIILALFLGAAFYVGRRLWQSFFAKSEGACPKGCGGACSAINVDALQRTIEKAQQQKQQPA